MDARLKSSQKGKKEEPGGSLLGAVSRQIGCGCGRAAASVVAAESGDWAQGMARAANQTRRGAG